jgi:hypothetical protein
MCYSSNFSQGGLRMRGLRGFGQALAVALAACTAGTEPTTQPREVRVDPNATGWVSGKVLTSGPTRNQGEQPAWETGDAPDTAWVRIGPVAGERMKPSRPLAGVVVELGIVRFDRSSDTAEGTTRAILVPFVTADAWSGPEVRFLDPGPAEAPGRFEVVARTRTDALGEFRFPRAPRGDMLMVRARPPAPYHETYCHAPFWLGKEATKEVDVVVRGR